MKTRGRVFQGPKSAGSCALGARRARGAARRLSRDPLGRWRRDVRLSGGLAQHELTAKAEERLGPRPADSAAELHVQVVHTAVLINGFGAVSAAPSEEAGPWRPARGQTRAGRQWLLRSRAAAGRWCCPLPAELSSRRPRGPPRVPERQNRASSFLVTRVRPPGPRAASRPISAPRMRVFCGGGSGFPWIPSSFDLVVHLAGEMG